MDECSLCGSSDKYSITPEIKTDVLRIHCPVCSDFLITADANLDIQSLSIQEKCLLSGLTRERSETGLPLMIATDVIESLLELAPKRVFEKAMKLLAAIDRKTHWFGEDVAVHYGTDYSLAYAQNSNEFKAIRDYLCERGLLKSSKAGDMHGKQTLSLLADGIAELEKHQQMNLDSHKAFVAMWFTEENNLKQVYSDQIAPGIREAGYEPMRIDFKEHNNDVVAEILSEIRQSRFLVSDFTGQRNGVYFEAGFAMGLSLPIIWMCHEDEIEKCAFDTNHFNHITWKSDETDLSARVRNRIIATIGKGPLQPR